MSFGWRGGYMNGIKKRLLLIPILFGLSTCSFSHHVIIIPNLEAASHYHHESVNNYYIQVGKFSHLAEAKRNQKLVQSGTIYPAKVKKIHGYYTVDVGPIHTAPDVRSAADSITRKLHAKPVLAAKKQVAMHQEVIVTKKPAVIQPLTTKPVQAPRATVAPIVEPKVAPNRPSFYLGAGAGESFYRVQGNNHLGTGAGWPNDSYNTDNVSNEPYGFVAAGYTWMLSDAWIPSYSLGLRYMYVAPTTISGHIDQYSLPGFTNYNYSYDVQLLNILATFKLDLYRWYDFMPYIMAGAGVSNVSTSNYTEQATSGVTPRVSPNFGTNSANNFAYQAGVGFDYVMKDDLWVNFEFNYANYGTVYTAKGANYSTLTGTNYDNEFLKNQLSATTVFLGLTYYPA
jgi:opacity protein-like surface antigen